MSPSQTRQTVRDSPGDGPVVIRPAVGADVESVLGSLGLSGPRSVLVVFGDGTAARTDGGETASPTMPAEKAIAAAARRSDAIIVDGVIGDGVDGGVATSCVESLAASIAGEFPVVAMLAGGGRTALSQAAAVVSRGWSLFVLAPSGGAADQIAVAKERGRIKDPSLRPIAASDRVTVVSSSDGTALTRRLTWALHSDFVLKDAWELFATYDRTSIRLRRIFERFQISILVLGVAATLLALLHREIGTEALRWAVIIASITVGALIALSGRHATGKRWVVTRAAAEAVKAEIFCYRTGTGSYADSRLPGANPARRPEVIASRLERIQTRLMHGEASSGSLVSYDGPLPPDSDKTGDDGLQPLDADKYLELRVDDQIAYYHRRLRSLERHRAVLQALAVAASATGALVAAVGAEIWVALTTAVAAAPLAYLAHLQVDSTIVSYNQSAARLAAVRRRWYSHPPESRTQQAFADLVHETEAVMTSERGGWVEQMTEALRELQDRQRSGELPMTDPTEKDSASYDAPPRHP